MKALVFHEPQRIAVEQVAEPAPGPGEALIRVAAAAICHSDIRVYLGQKHARPGVIPGHEIVGSIAALGPDTPAGLHEGDRVVVCPIVACGSCVFCLSGRRHRCPQRITLGYQEHGGLAEYVLAPAGIVSLGHLIPVPDDLPLERACVTEPVACVLNSLETCEVSLGGSLALVGAGPMGLFHLLLAQRIGATTIIVSEPDEARAQAARRMGATEVIDPRNADLAATVLEHTGGLGADAVVVSAGLPHVLAQAIGSVRKQGVVNLFAGFPPETSVPFDPNAVHYSEVRLTGTQNASPEQYRRILQLLRRMPDIDAITTHRYPLDEATRAYDVRLRNEGLKSIVVMAGSPEDQP